MASPVLRSKQFYTDALARADIGKAERAMLQDEYELLQEQEREAYEAHARFAQKAWAADLAQARGGPLMTKATSTHRPPASSGRGLSPRVLAPIIDAHVKSVVKAAAEPVIAELKTRIGILEKQMLEMRAARGQRMAKAVDEVATGLARDRVKRKYAERSNGTHRH